MLRRRALLVPLAILVALPAKAAPATAPDPFAECDAAVQARPDAVDAYRCYWQKSRQNRAAEAIARLERRLARVPEDHSARLYLARIEGDRGNDRAERLYGQAIRGLVARDDRRGEVFARLGLILFLGRRGRLAEADAELAAAWRAAAADRELQSWVRNAQAWQAFHRGDYGGAWRLFKQVELEVFPDGDPDLRAQCLSGLGGVCQETGRYAEAFEYARRQADLCHQSGDLYDEARARGNLVLSAFRLGVAGEMQPAEIAELAQAALVAARAAGNRGSEARAELYLGDLTTGSEARAHYRRGLEISGETREIAGLVLGVRGTALSLVESAPRDVPAAQRLADQAVDLARGSRFYTTIAALAKARIAALSGDRDPAVAAAGRALDAIEAMRDLQSDDVVRARVFSNWTFAYHRLVGYLLTRPQPTPADVALAFAVSERMRARVLLDELDAAQASVLVSPSGALRDQRDALLQEIARAQRGLMQPEMTAADRRRALAELERLELAEERVRSDYARANPAYAALRQPSLASLAQVQRALAGDQALLAFQIAGRFNVDNRSTADGSWLWAVTRHQVRFYPLPDRERLRPVLGLYLGLLERRDGAEGAAGARLYETLLARALAELPSGIDRLVIVPDGLLHRVPLGALRPDDASPRLASRFEISMVPSATLWLRFRGERPTAALAAHPVLALADPGPLGAPTPGAERMLPFGPTPLAPLPHARQEAQAVVRRLGGASQLLLGKEASEASLKRAPLERFSVLHFATHAVIDEQNPARSAIVLSPGAEGEDGLLQIRDVVGLDLGGRLVVLSACRTAGGTLLEGEGPMGLARAFFQAGAPTVVGSLWPLRDDDAERLFGAFYRHLGRGGSAASALAAAQREQMARGAHPAAWAGVVVLGYGDAVPFPGGAPGRRWPMPWPALAVAGALAGIGWWSHHRRSAIRFASG